MAKQVVIPTAVERGKNKLDVRVRNIQTLGVNDARCSASFLLEKGDKINVNFNQFSRLSPLVAPTFGDFKIKTHAFWVPMRLVWHHYLEYFQNTLDASFADISNPINFSLQDLMNVICPSPALRTGNSFMEFGAVFEGFNDEDAENYDIRFADYIDEKLYCYNFTAYGRMVWSNLQALGYGLPTFVPFFSSTPSTPSTDEEEVLYYLNTASYSIYPLLALARVFYDWLYPSQYVVQQGFGILFLDTIYDEWSSNKSLVFDQIFKLFVTTYDRGFYTSLWAQPNQVAPNTSGGRGASNLGLVYDQELNFSGEMSVRSDIPSGSDRHVFDVSVEQSSASLNTTLTASSLRWLTALADYVQRTNLGGNRVREFMKSHFGFVGSDLRSDVSSWIRTFTDHVQIQDVTNMSSDNATSVLGEQGGKGMSAGNGIVRFEANEKGFLLFVTQVVPSIGYYQGQAKETREITSRFDLYNPDFDGVGMEGVPRRALFSQYRTFEDTTKVNYGSLIDVFGFAPMYSEWKLGRDILSGDFLFGSRNRNLDSYHTFRDILYGRNNLALDAKFLMADNQSQRIFAYVGEENEQGLYAQYDKIFNFMRFDATKYTCMKSLSESIPFFDEDSEKTKVSYEGDQI